MDIIKDNGTYVKPHYKTNSNNTNLDNFSTESNYNPYNQNQGSRAKDYSKDAFNYGAGRQIQTRSKGGLTVMGTKYMCLKGECCRNIILYTTFV